MNEQELRALVRESIAKQLGEPAPQITSIHTGPHPSHGVYLIARDDENGPCIIEPSVPCTHCNYCKSHGH